MMARVFAVALVAVFAVALVAGTSAQDLSAMVAQCKENVDTIAGLSADSTCASMGAAVDRTYGTLIGSCPTLQAKVDAFSSATTCTAVKTAYTNLCDELEVCTKKDDPCFAKDTGVFAVNGETISMSSMASLKAGDYIMDGPNSFARVIVNQHRVASVKSSLLQIDHTDGEISLTPDHVLEVDGKFVPARLVSAGCKLGESKVSRVTTKTGDVINPLTTSGKILTQGGVLASTYPEWIAEYMLSSYLLPLPLSLSNLISFLFPETTQVYYDALIEPLVTAVHPKHLKAALPARLVPAAFLLGDLALTVGFIAFSLASPMVLVAAVAVTVAAKVRK